MSTDPGSEPKVAPGSGSGADLDRERLSKLLGMLGSAHDGEALVAARKADKLIRNAGLSWSEVLEPFDQLRIAGNTARQLLAEKEALTQALQEALQRKTRQSADGWETVGNPSDQARWCLDLNADGEVFLNLAEEHLLIGVERGEPLTERQRWFFERVLREACARTGKAPP